MGISFKKDLVVDRVQIHLVNKEDEKDLNTIDNQFFFERYSHDLILFSTMTKGYKYYVPIAIYLATKYILFFLAYTVNICRQGVGIE